jgi:hypothetical protein
MRMAYPMPRLSLAVLQLAAVTGKLERAPSLESRPQQRKPKKTDEAPDHGSCERISPI